MSVFLRKRKLKSGRYTLFLDVYIQGKRKQEPLNLYINNDGSKNDQIILATAHNILAKRRVDLANASNDLATVYASEESFLDYFERYVTAAKAEYKGAVGKYMRELYPRLRFKDVTEDTYYEIRNYLQTEKSYQEWTLYTAMWYIRSALNKAVKEGIISRNPWHSIKTHKPETTRDFLEFDDLVKLKETSCGNEVIKRAFLFSCFTGLRFSDVRALKWENVEEGTVTLRMKKTKTMISIPLSKSALEQLGERSEPELPVFDLPKSDGTVGYYIKIWAAAAGIKKKVTFHVARHTFATLLITYGADLESAQELLGHSDIRTTKVYVRILAEKKKAAISKLPEL